MMYIFFLRLQSYCFFLKIKKILLQKMIHSPCKGLDDSLHLQCEEEGSEARNVDIRLYGDEIHLQVVGLGEDFYDELLLGR